jgi:hypothetical protein
LRVAQIWSLFPMDRPGEIIGRFPVDDDGVLVGGEIPGQKTAFGHADVQ